MKVLRTTMLGILYFIGISILAVVVSLIIFWGYFSLQLFMFGEGDYLLFIANDFNVITAIMIIILVIFVLCKIKERFFDRKDKQLDIVDKNCDPLAIEDNNKLEEENKNEEFHFKSFNECFVHDEKRTKAFKMIKIIYIPILIIFIYLGMTSYAILYPQSIKVSSPIVPKGIVYEYNDIENVDVGISKITKNSYSLYYKVTFNDGKSVDFFCSTMQQSKDISFEYILLDFDKKLRSQGVVKNVNKKNFENYSKGLDAGFVSRVEKLFDEK